MVSQAKDLISSPHAYGQKFSHFTKVLYAFGHRPIFSSEARYKDTLEALWKRKVYLILKDCSRLSDSMKGYGAVLNIKRVSDNISSIFYKFLLNLLEYSYVEKLFMFPFMQPPFEERSNVFTVL